MEENWVENKETENADGQEKSYELKLLRYKYKQEEAKVCMDCWDNVSWLLL